MNLQALLINFQCPRCGKKFMNYDAGKWLPAPDFNSDPSWDSKQYGVIKPHEQRAKLFRRLCQVCQKNGSLDVWSTDIQTPTKKRRANKSQ